VFECRDSLSRQANRVTSVSTRPFLSRIARLPACSSNMANAWWDGWTRRCSDHLSSPIATPRTTQSPQFRRTRRLDRMLWRDACFASDVRGVIDRTGKGVPLSMMGSTSDGPSSTGTPFVPGIRGWLKRRGGDYRLPPGPP